MKRTVAVAGIVALPLVLASLVGGPGSTSTPGPVEPAPASIARDPGRHGASVPECLLPALAIDPFPCAAAILVEARTGAILYAQDADSSRAPASLAKMMLEVLVLEEIGAGRASYGDSVLVSEWAASMGGATVEIRPGERVDLGSLLRAVVVVSANDASVAIAEHLAGTEPAFVARMNERAAALGCTSTRFVNSHGLDMPPEESRSTAADLVRIARRLLELPGALELASSKETEFRAGAPALVSTNELLGTIEGVDGLKTGLTSKAGSCFCGTIERGGVRFVSVVLGAEPGPSRFDVTCALYERAYAGGPHWIVDPDATVPPRLLLARAGETR